MDKRRLLIASATIAVSHLAVCANAHAAVGLATMPGTLALYAARQPERCEAAVRPAADIAAPAALAGMSKSQAILGGQVSQLELIARQQAGITTETQVAVAAQLAGASLAPSAGGGDCQRFAIPSVSTPAIQPGPIQALLASDDFLASKRLPVSKTAFDAAWNRVRHSGISRRLMASLIRDLPGPATSATLVAVNSWTNASVRFVEDNAGYGMADYWANAKSTLQRGQGDCEDIAIAKMQLLSALGIPPTDMYLTIARDLARNADHALLVVKLDGKSWLLDNATNDVLDASRSYDYRPILSFSGSNKWLHGYRTAVASAR